MDKEKEEGIIALKKMIAAQEVVKIERRIDRHKMMLSEPKCMMRKKKCYV